MPDSIEDRVRILEEQSAKLGAQGAPPKSKDVWDKLAALSTLLSGVIIASIGIWVNHSLTTGQQRAQDAQATATRKMEEAHNTAAEIQAANAQKLQAQQAADALAFQKQQAIDGKELERLRMQQQREQAAHTLQQQREHDHAVLTLQQTQLAKDFMPMIAGADAKSRTSALLLLAQVSKPEALILARSYSETSADASLVQASETVLVSLEKGSDPELSKAASTARAEVTIAKRIQAITNVFEGGKPTRIYGAIYFEGASLVYGGIFTSERGDLYEVVSRYCAASGASKADALKSWLDRMKSKDSTLDHDPDLIKLLKQAAQDPVMQQVQDEVFDEHYWKPAQNHAVSLGLKLPLSLAVIFDTGVNLGAAAVSSFASSATTKLGGDPSRGVDEKAWVSAFVDARRARLAARGLPFPGLLHRVDFFRSTIDSRNWNLDLPLKVLSVSITE